MIFKEFNEEILSTLCKKQCILSFISAPYAQGPSGLIFVLFSDGLLCYKNQNNEGYNNSFLKLIKSYVPELVCPINCNYKKRKVQVFTGYLGGGNFYSMIESEHEKYLEFCKTNHAPYEYKKFQNFLLSKYGLNIKDIYSLSIKNN